MVLNTKQKIANFLYYFPDSTMEEIVDNTPTANTLARKLVNELIKQGDVIYRKRGRTWLYSASPDYQPVHQDVFAIPHPAELKKIAACEERINDLLSRGLHRRARTELRRLSAMQSTARGVEAVARMASKI